MASGNGTAQGTPPTGGLRSAANPLPGGVAPWATFAAQTREHVPELRWPRRNVTYDRMRTDAQAEALFTGTSGPIELYTWWVDPNGNDPGKVALLAEDWGLPVGEPDPEDAGAWRELGAIERTSLPDEFDFGEMLHEALLGLVFGHYYFEWVFDLVDGLYRLVEMAAVHPATIADLKVDKRGRLLHIKQTGSASGTLLGGGLMGDAPKIGPDSLLPFVWMGDATCPWLGRSMFRPMYRNWLVKDVLIRVDVTNHERAGGVPVARTDATFQGVDLADLQRLAAEFRIDEEGGAAMPPGAWLELLRAGTSDVVTSMRWQDEQMAQVWHAMVRQLGTTATGSRALGGTLVDLEALARRAIAEWIRKSINRWGFARWWMWNFGERNAPVLRFTPPQLEGASPSSVAPAAPPGDGEGGGPPPRAATARPSPRRTAGGGDAQRELGSAQQRGEDAVGGGQSADNQMTAGRNGGPSVAPGPAPTTGAQRTDSTVALAAAADPTGGAFSRHRLPDRELRRQPYPHEVAAAVDFAAIDIAYDDAAERLDGLFLSDWLPAQLAAISDQVTHTQSGSARRRVTAQAMSRLTAPVVGTVDLPDVLYEVAARGAEEAAAEVGAQGVAQAVPSETQLRALVADHARAVAQQTADGVSLAASRRAVQLTGGGLTAPQLASEVVSYVEGLRHVWERDQLAGAAQQALNAGRLHVFEQVEGIATAPYASELLDAATCENCVGVDGTLYESVRAARADYPSGGYRECLGGARCRGTVVLVLESETAPGSMTVT